MSTMKLDFSFAPTERMLKAAQNVLAKMAFLDLISPVVKEYTELVLAERQWPVAERFAIRLNRHFVTRYEDIYLLETDLWPEFYTRVNEVRLEIGIYVKESDLCPKSVASTQLYQAEFELLSVMSELTQVPAEKINVQVPSKRQQIINTILALLVPFINQDELPHGDHMWILGQVSKSIDEARELVCLTARELGLTLGAWEIVSCDDRQRESAILKIDDQHCLAVSIDTHGVVAVNGNPYTLDGRQMNNKLAYIHDSINRRVKTIRSESSTTNQETICSL